MILIFDLDGTVMDTWEEIQLAFERVFRRKALELDYKKLRMAVGLPLDKVVSSLTGKEEPALVEEIRNTFLSISPRKIKLFEGMRNILDLPIKKAVFTSKGDLGTYRDLKYLNIKDKFEYVVTADMLKNKKPHPEGILKILNFFEVNRAETMMIGDTELDILAAKNAGVKSVAVTWGNRDYEYLLKYKPDYIVKATDELASLIKAHAHL